ncbi:hypothetical protein AtubIFM55763_001552 [Aspergillus tubingensis]|uniref:Uncharacterized protein n=3 Tax=Aspergillus subgen. Circumdati TaxID=2720871 RepID=A0A1L9NB63_ASPTC|nr:hypothetical protein BO88DRAFT_400418 [Aspergillus vadensis CBS 113365]XP_035356942.1 uncharacterized protein AtWU_05939 [Aspergillus tubingensis]OJI86374.1 hypothetical protein ASPTUDRAFT_187772 [Aspergillus tubingensis CBS 134.48]PYH74741.1 hypothetical protein BO88DRAFT_400418 [Aspergillus vadensis CBS 113365]GFN16138.1 hypothetical protein AtWU_05939 [Aspergillus tubingensis]GLA60600.1 hypothetical protein AtubIFM54640_001079 [Aspergillus tubingensis]GLA71183.1 hypothetical protein Atu
MPPIHPSATLLPASTQTTITTSEQHDQNAAPHTHLFGRSSTTWAPGSGTVEPSHINMKGLMALFAILGAAFVLAAIWFFFWAKNGGFIWRKGDWEEYKSTVLRRKGPDGRTLSNATKSTKLGGGSVYHKGYSDDGYTYTDETATNLTEKTGVTGATSAEKERKRRRKLREKFRRRRKDDEMTANWENEVDEDVAAYRKEKAARVGGINREGEGTYYGSDYDLSNPASHYNQSEISGSQVRDYAYDPAPAPAKAPSRKQSRRRDFSFVPGSEDTLSQAPTRDDHHDRRHSREPSARRHNRRRERRRNPPPSESSGSRTSSPRKRERQSVRGHYTEPLDFSSSAPSRSEYQYSNVDTEDTGTRSYHHPIPGLSKGYRREGGRGRRRDSLSESD